MLVRGPSLAESMSQYLIDRIKAIDNIEVLTRTEIVALYGSREKQLESVRWRNNVNGEETEKPIRHVFCFIGAEPATGWLRNSGIALDGKNFVLTGSDVPSGARPSNNGSDRPLSLETSVRGVFASGDVRSGSVKRVGAAIGEGAVVGAELHVARADRAAESSGDAEKDSGMGSVGAMGMRLNPHCTPERAHQDATAELSGVAPAYSAAGLDKGR